MIKNIIVTLVFSLICLSGSAQLLEDEEAKTTVKAALDKIYNNEEVKAKAEIVKLKDKYGKHAIYPLLNSMLLLDKLHLEEKAKKYMALLDHAEMLSEGKLKKDEDDIEAMFFAMTTHSYKALFHSEQKNYLKAVGEAQKTYKYIKKAYELTDEFPEFLLSVGLYNYYRVQYPETHPAVKPFVGIFKDGNKALGLKQLEKCVEVTTFTRPEALSYITHIYLKYEDEYKKGLKYAEIAFNDFPNNPYFKTRYAEGLLRNKKYSKALSFIEELINGSDTLYSTVGLVFRGYYYEFGEKDDEKAAKCYAKALDNYEEYPSLDQEYACWCHIGLARILERKGQTKQAEELYKEALDGGYESIRKEAKKFLKEQ